ncbi:hypothetical protein CkaCkLH20_13265 [Colletotrichum karsti]|uniref:Uncharacterized protein n=1 Tax=Colletotrichum karsti TaxID=1095194 RepID=A0A9P6LDM5_9PEZI|nr:uncharacterized protein CkaCkLH20_13265 [Colletotrichum karsti]KAF9869263.1 hypothetical protein CkaCkLH20_13265 [Colletotrichum karsti]
MERSLQCSRAAGAPGTVITVLELGSITATWGRGMRFPNFLIALLSSLFSMASCVIWCFNSTGSSSANAETRRKEMNVSLSVSEEIMLSSILSYSPDILSFKDLDNNDEIYVMEKSKDQNDILSLGTSVINDKERERSMWSKDFVVQGLRGPIVVNKNEMIYMTSSAKETTRQFTQCSVHGCVDTLAVADCQSCTLSLGLSKCLDYADFGDVVENSKNNLMKSKIVVICYDIELSTEKRS